MPGTLNKYWSEYRNKFVVLYFSPSIVLAQSSSTYLSLLTARSLFSEIHVQTSLWGDESDA